MVMMIMISDGTVDDDDESYYNNSDSINGDNVDYNDNNLRVL